MQENDSPDPLPSSTPFRERRVTITASLGLHARPAARFVKLAETFDAEIWVLAKGVRVSGGSIMGLMMLAAGPGTELVVTARGPDAETALAALGDLLEYGIADT